MYMSESNQWKNKFQDLMQVCQSELKKTAEIGKKMISASQSSAAIEKSYIELGKLVFNSHKDGDLNWDNELSKKLIEKITSLKLELEEIEKEVQDIKN